MAATPYTGRYSEIEMRAHTDIEYEAAIDAQIPVVWQALRDKYGTIRWDGMSGKVKNPLFLLAMRDHCIRLGLRRW